MESTTPGGFTWFLNTCQDSYYLDEDLAKQRDSRNLPDRIREIESNDEELADARGDADDTRRKTKRIVEDLQDSTTKTGDAVYNHDDFDCATSGNFQTQTSPKDSLGQAPSYQVANPSAKRTLWGKLGDLLSRSNMSHKRQSLPVAPLRFVDQCSECHDLRESYGKTRIEDLTLSMKNGCDLCGVVLAVLEEYCHDLQPKARVRLFAPFQPGSTLTLWCQGETGTMGSIPFLIEVYVPLGNPSPSPSIAEAPEITGDTSSALAISKAQSWLQICKVQHRKCPRNDHVQLPTRLVLISETESGHFMRLVETGGQYGRYACLSHRWGEPGSVLTTTDDNYGEHLEGISFESISPTFKQAIITAWRLGFQYIWIDSLCIIQGNTKDWEAQASKMEANYRLADITLSASKSFGPKSGCYSLSDPEYLGRTVPWLNKSGRQYTISARRPIAHARKWPLFQRGWVYQERLLSPRILHFGHQELVWECAQGSLCECGQSMNFCSELRDKFEHHHLYAGKPTGEELRDLWREIVQEYSNRDLTYHADTLPALAGLARQMHRVRGSHYLAGLWEDSLVGDLLWLTREINAGYFEPGPRPESSLAPTWSWSSFKPAQEGSIIGTSRISYHEIGDVASTSGSERCREHIKTVYATIVAADCQPSGVDEFGQVATGQITLNAPVVNGLIQTVPRASPPKDDAAEWERSYYESHKNDQLSQLKMTNFDSFDEVWGGLSDNEIFMEFYPDYGLYLPGHGHVESNTFVKVAQMALVDGGPSFSPEHVVCLVLRETSNILGIQKYERIGLAKCSISRREVDWFANAESMVLHII